MQALSERLRLVSLKSSVFWDITPFNPLKVNTYISEEYAASGMKSKPVKNTT
jgi:hypothetical protein